MFITFILLAWISRPWCPGGFLAPLCTLHGGLICTTFCPTVHLTGRPTMPSWGAKVTVWVVVGCEPNYGVQKWLLRWNWRIDMQTYFHLVSTINTHRKKGTKMVKQSLFWQKGHSAPKGTILRMIKRCHLFFEWTLGYCGAINYRNRLKITGNSDIRGSDIWGLTVL